MQKSFSLLMPNSIAPSLYGDCDKPFGLGFNFMNNTETWLNVAGYEGLYIISDHGRLKSAITSKIRKLQPDYKRGYLKARISKNNKFKSVSIHRLVAIAFIPNPENKPCVNHKNGIHTDNRIENLEWVTYSENTIHSYTVLKRKGVNHNKYGILNSNHKSVNQLSLYGSFIRRWDSIIEAERAGVALSVNISACCKGKVKTVCGFKWEYA